MALQITQEFSKYIGIPYSKVDCWGLAELFYKQEFGIDLVKYYFTRPENKEETDFIVRSHREEYLKTNTPEYGDLILFKVLGTLSHIGIYLDGEKMLHSDFGKDSVIESWNSIKWKNRVEGFYKVKL